MTLRYYIHLLCSIIMLMFVTGQILGCGHSQNENVFPEISGFKKSDTHRYSPQTLFEYINGAAEYYIIYNFKELSMQKYEASGDRTITVEIYNQSSPRDAFGIYSQERPYECEFINIGAQANYVKGYLNFYKGDYYVKISSYNLGEKGRELLSKTAKSISDGLGGNENVPELLNVFPEKNKIENSEAYISKDFLGYSFFRNVFTCNYLQSGNQYQVFIIGEKDESSTKDTLSSYKNTVNASEGILSGGIHEIEDPYQGKIVLASGGRYITGILDPDNEKIDTDILRKILSSLE